MHHVEVPDTPRVGVGHAASDGRIERIKVWSLYGWRSRLRAAVSKTASELMPATARYATAITSRDFTVMRGPPELLHCNLLVSKPFAALASSLLCLGQRQFCEFAETHGLT